MYPCDVNQVRVTQEQEQSSPKAHLFGNVVTFEQQPLLAVPVPRDITNVTVN